MNGHTPGPWLVQNSKDVFSRLGTDSGDGTICDDNDGWYIADVMSYGACVNGEQTELGYDIVKANARLIASAPKLLKALAQIKHSIQQARIAGNDWKRELVLIENTTDAAIAEATGEKSCSLPAR